CETDTDVPLWYTYSTNVAYLSDRAADRGQLVCDQLLGLLLRNLFGSLGVGPLKLCRQFRSFCCARLVWHVFPSLVFDFSNCNLAALDSFSFFSPMCADPLKGLVGFARLQKVVHNSCGSV